MKISTLLAFFFLLLFSCSKNIYDLPISEQSKLMKEDPIVMDFFRAISISAKILTEGDLDLKKYREIVKPYKGDICNIKKEIFNGDSVMEKFADINCQMLTTGKAYHAKYPFIKDLSEEERKELIKPLIVKNDYDMETVKKNAKKRFESMDPKVKEELMKMMKKDPNADLEFLSKNLKIDIEKLKKLIEPFSKVVPSN